MARPKKPREVDGVILPDNLLLDPRKRQNYWRYKKEDGSYKTFQAPIEIAVKKAEKANKIREIQRESKTLARTSFARFVQDYIPYRERLDKELANKHSWKNRKASLIQLAKHFADVPTPSIRLENLQKWWDTQSGYAQRSKRAEYNKFFNFLMAKDAVPRLKGNPFTISDVSVRLMAKPLPKKSKLRITIKDFWDIYRLAGEKGYLFIQLGMAICLLTTMRRGDLVNLRFDKSIVDGFLCRGISKSIEKDVNGNGEHLSWDLSIYTELRGVINKARELSLVNSRCPYILSYAHKKRYDSPIRNHRCQVLPDYLTRHFAEIRDLLPQFKDMPIGKRPGIHEVRALSGHLLTKEGYTPKQIQEVYAHTDVEMTEVYLAKHETEYKNIGLVLTSETMGRSF